MNGRDYTKTFMRSLAYPGQFSTRPRITKEVRATGSVALTSA
jgi:hypothetical protein